jgi:hypothetical protein
MALEPQRAAIKQHADQLAASIVQAMSAMPAPDPVPVPAPVTAPAAAAPAAEPTFEKAKPAENPRNQIMREIVKGSNARLEADAKETFPVTDDDGNLVSPAADAVPEAGPAPEDDEQNAAAAPAVTDAVPVEPLAPAAAAPAAAIPATATPVDPKAIDPNADYPVTVDGQKILVKGSKIIDAGFRTFQKETAADYRLQLATSMLDEARRTAAQAQPPATAGAAATAPVAGAQQVDAAKLAEAIQFGTQEQAAEALRLLQQRDPSTVTMEGLQTFMRQQLPDIVNAQLAFREAANFAKTEYADLLADPYLKDMFLMKEDQLRKAGDARPPAELYKAIGDDIRTHFNRPKAAAPTPPPQTMAQRQAAKVAAPSAPRLAAARLESGAAAEKPKTTQDIIANMRAKRGQGSLNRI